MFVRYYYIVWMGLFTLIMLFGGYSVVLQFRCLFDGICFGVVLALTLFLWAGMLCAGLVLSLVD